MSVVDDILKGDPQVGDHVSLIYHDSRGESFFRHASVVRTGHPTGERVAARDVISRSLYYVPHKKPDSMPGYSWRWPTQEDLNEHR